MSTKIFNVARIAELYREVHGNIILRLVSYYKQVLSSSWDRRPFGHNRHRPKRGGSCCDSPSVTVVNRAANFESKFNANIV